LDVWNKYIHKWGREGCGDFFFISMCYENTKEHFWLDRIVSKTQKLAGRGMGENNHE